MSSSKLVSISHGQDCWSSEMVLTDCLTNLFSWRELWTRLYYAFLHFLLTLPLYHTSPWVLCQYHKSPEIIDKIIMMTIAHKIVIYQSCLQIYPMWVNIFVKLDETNYLDWLSLTSMLSSLSEKTIKREVRKQYIKRQSIVSSNNSIFTKIRPVAVYFFQITGRYRSETRCTKLIYFVCS